MKKEAKKEEKSDFRERLKTEILGVFWLACGLFLALALASYSNADPSFNNNLQPATVRNLGGSVGAHAADLIWQLFGLPALLLPVSCFVLAWRRFTQRGGRFAPRRLVYFLVLLLALDGLLALVLGDVSWFGEHIGEAGGAAGRMLTDLLVKAFNPVGTAILLLVLLVVSAMAALRLSLVQVLSDQRERLRAWWQELLAQRAVTADEVPAGSESRETIRQVPVIAPQAPPIKPSPPPAERKKRRADETDIQEAFEFLQAGGQYQKPPLALLDHEGEEARPIDRQKLTANARILETKLRDFGVQGEVTEVKPGPVVTMYEFSPAPGVKVNKIAGLADDLAMALSAIAIRIVAPIPGQGVVGIEIPNNDRETVYLKEIMASDAFQRCSGRLPMALGKDIFGHTVVADLAKMPHLLVAGATGSGKSVSINTMILSLLYYAAPHDVRIILIDPKMLELSIYEGVPHLLLPVVTNPKKAALAFNWAVREMERRYRLMADKEVRNIDGYNQRIAEEQKKGGVASRREAVPEDAGEAALPMAEVVEDQEELEHEHLPRIVVIVDELADLMMVAGREIEESIARLAQMARAAGIHLILATQRPSVDVITGLIKANFPTRVSFKVFSRIDSRTILDQMGAESLLGMGDMLYLPPGTGALQRVHGAFVSETEVKRVVDFLARQGKPEYDVSILEAPPAAEGGGDDGDELDEKWDEALALVAETRQASISMLQRRLRVGYNRAARMIEKMEQEGIVGPSDGTSRPREVFINRIES
jgi:DNA segregation ATPase FtsK/SpoIIIE, S-DNA-T family